MRVLIVDPKSLLREALAALLRSLIAGLEVVAVPTVAEAAPVMGRFALGLLIMDSEQASRNHLLDAIRLVHPGWRIALLDGPAQRGGPPHVDGHIGMDDDSATVIAEVRRLIGGSWSTRSAPAAGSSAWLLAGATEAATAGITDRVGHRPPSPAPTRSLTPRQAEVLRLLGQGRSTKEIARTLDLGIGTIKAHLDAIYRTLGVHSRTAAVARAQEFARPAPSGGAPHAPAGSNVVRLDIRAGQRMSSDPADTTPPRPSTAAR